MNQSSTIAFFLLGGFIIYITIKGELPSYAGVLGIGPKATTATATPTVTNSGIVPGGTSTMGNVLSGAINSALGR